MASQKHLDILNQGVTAWNQWREAHPNRQPDLSDAELQWFKLNSGLLDFTKRNPIANLSSIDFHGVNLSGATLHEANLSNANLQAANLSGSDLSMTNLTHAHLHNANLSTANLWGADLTMADLSDANLSAADLSRATLVETNLQNAALNGAKLDDANFQGADLRNANLSVARLAGTNLHGTSFREAIIASTMFMNVDLSHTKELSTVLHRGPSGISIDTIYRSHGQISERFLRKAGVPSSFLEIMATLTSRPIEYYSVFLSYANPNQNFAERLYADLQSKGVRCWFAPEDLKIGDHYHQRIDESIRLYDKLVLILSEHAVQSTWVEREVVAAREKEERQHKPVLFPIRLDDSVMDTTKAWAADVRRRWHIGDFTQWKDHDHYQQALERLMRDLNKEK